MRSFEGIELASGSVRPEWIDANAHMNVAYYVLAFDLAIDDLWLKFGIDATYIETRRLSTFAVESHVSYVRELREGEPYRITSQILAYDAKRIHQFMRMYHATEGFLAATSEWLNLHVDLSARRVAPWPDDVVARIERLALAQIDTAWPDAVKGCIEVREPKFRLGQPAATYAAHGDD